MAVQTVLDKGVVVCPCGSASFVAVRRGARGNLQYRMTRNWDLTLHFDSVGLSFPESVYCGGCGEQVIVSPAVNMQGG
jgi:hypothetical protein